MPTIAAVSTPPGEGGIAIVRVSGPGARAVAGAVLRTAAGGVVALESRVAVVARAVTPDRRPVDEVLSLWMPGPASYTREDVLEIHCHGGHAAARRILSLCLAAGARPAGPGEFTLRAFLNGRIDLVQAEAVLDVIRARGDAALAAHQALLGGDLSREVAGWQEDLGRVLVHLEAFLDFPDEEDVGEPDLDRLLADLERLGAAMDAKLATYAWGRTVRDGFTAALVGPPNAGKSSLLNRLLGEDRVIVTEVPGTTRDAVDGWIQPGGVPVRLVDTAGLRAPGDPVEAEGVRRARRAAEEADCVVLVFDGARAPTPAERAEIAGQTGPVLPVANKIDLGRAGVAIVADVLGRPPLELSALTGEGVTALTTELARLAGERGAGGVEAPLTRDRHRIALDEARAAVGRAADLLRAGGFPEVAASELHGSRRALAGLLGWGTPEDVLDGIFEEFCVGK